MRKLLTIGVDTTTGRVVDVIFSMADGSVGTAWGCSAVLPSGCAGARCESDGWDLYRGGYSVNGYNGFQSATTDYSEWNLDHFTPF